MPMIAELPKADVLSGTERVPIVKAGKTQQTTTRSIAELVPSKRCETCQHWDRLHEATAFGACSRYSLSAELPLTTDLTVCSNWTRKPEAVE